MTLDVDVNSLSMFMWQLSHVFLEMLSFWAPQSRVHKYKEYLTFKRGSISAILHENENKLKSKLGIFLFCQKPFG